jgi:hypothetical protein
METGINSFKQKETKMTWREFHERIIDGIKQGTLLAIPQDGEIRFFTQKHLSDGTIEPALIEEALSAEEYARLAQQDMAASNN